MNIIEYAEKRLNDEAEHDVNISDIRYWAGYLDGARAQKKEDNLDNTASKLSESGGAPHNHNQLLYPLNKQYVELIKARTDLETGRLVLSSEELETLRLEREEKVENLALDYKNSTAEIDAINAEIGRLKCRADNLEKYCERLKFLLMDLLNGQEFTASRFCISNQKTSEVKIMEWYVFMAWANKHGYLRYYEPDPDRTAIKSALEEGKDIPGVALIDNYDIVIK